MSITACLYTEAACEIVVAACSLHDIAGKKKLKLEALVANHCPKPMHVDKTADASKVRHTVPILDYCNYTIKFATQASSTNTTLIICHHSQQPMPDIQRCIGA